jgi:hypothetical protein
MNASVKVLTRGAAWPFFLAAAGAIGNPCTLSVSVTVTVSSDSDSIRLIGYAHLKFCRCSVDQLSVDGGTSN